MMNPKSQMVCVLVGLFAMNIPLLAQAQSSANDMRDGNSDARRSWLPFTAHGYAGASIGGTQFDLGGCAGPGECEESSIGGKLYTGGRLMRGLGLELGYVYLGDIDRDGGQIRAHGVNLGLVGLLPIGEGFNITGKVGGIFSWTRVTSDQPNVPMGREHDLGLSYGFGAQWDLRQAWTLRADWDRYRLPLAGGRDDADLISVGMQYKF